MRVHLDVLGWLYVLMGTFGVLTGISLEVLASGTHVAIAQLGDGDTPSATVWLFLLVGLIALATGGLMMLAGRAILRRDRLGRPAALLLAVPNLALLPFGTGLAVYTFWTLLNDDARREFGRPPRSPEARPYQ
jgi:hypothetical protein